MKRFTHFELLTNIIKHFNSLNHNTQSTDEQIEALKFLDGLYWNDSAEDIDEFIKYYEEDATQCQELEIYINDLKRHKSGDFKANELIIY